MFFDKKIISLCGFMLSGKTTIGKLLAKKLNYNFYDLDEIIVNKTNKEIKDIFKFFGEKYFRMLEFKTLNEILNTINKNSIIALGGGTVTILKTLKLITKYSRLIYLKVSFDEIKKRMLSLNETEIIKRPLLINNDMEGLYNLYHKREKCYLSAPFIFECNELSADKIVDEIILRYNLS